MSLTWLRFAIRRTPFYAPLRFVRDRREERRWQESSERHGPAPHRLKVRTLRDYARRYGLRALIETGTYYGDTIWRVRRDFDRIVSIEIDPRLSAKARDRFRSQPHLEFVVGDSGVKLREVLTTVTQPSLFWLDGHYSGEITSRGELDSPIEQELEHIWRHPVRRHVILIDDAHEFVGQGGYPTIDQLRDAVRKARPDWSFEVRDNIIRVCPPPREQG
jgi:hypothetical protein